MDLVADAIAFILFVLAVLSMLALLVFPGLASLGLPELSSLAGLLEKPAEPVPADFARYFGLRNASCGTLSGDFLIVTHDFSDGYVEGLLASVPEEEAVAQGIADRYDFSQTTKTYVLGDWMKRVNVSAGGAESTIIWKNGRIYECAGGACTMRLMDGAESSAYYDSLNAMREGCMHFGRTPLPAYADAGMLLHITSTGVIDVGGNRCENFLIYSNRTYAERLLSTGGLSDEQRALLWALAHLDGPVRECLDESTGIIVYRKLTLDLSDVYMFDYLPGGGMRALQETTLDYFTSDVPESFLSLPEQD